MSSSNVYIFWDNSNIFISAKYVALRKEGSYAEHSIRIQFDHLYDLAKAGRTVSRALCVGSVPPELAAVWSRLQASGVNVELYERGTRTGTEQGIDQCLQVHMLRALADEKQPGVAVLVTGDGVGYDTGVGFHADLERMQKDGWGIEVIAWDLSCNKKLKQWAQMVGAYIPLESYYDSVTFVEGTRASSQLSLKSRAMASPLSPIS